MPQAKRARNASRPRSSAAAAADPPRSSGWFSGRRGPSASRRADDDGTPLHEEIILFIFATFLDIADLVRCAATCRRWRRLVSGDAAFICRGLQRPGPGGKFIPPLAVGYFRQHDADTIHFVPMAPALRRFPLLREPTSPSVMLVGDVRFDTSRIVTSRNGLIVIELRRGKHSRTLKLCVCNPMTGEVRALPPLTGKDGVGYYACTVLTADDYQYQVQNSDAGTPPPSASHYRLLMVYNRRDFTAFRSYSSEDGGGWGPERKVTGARLGKRHMRLTHGGVVACGGRAAYWKTSGGGVFGLRLDTLEATKVSLLEVVGGGEAPAFNVLNTLLGMAPDGRLCAVQLSLPFLQTQQGKSSVDTITIRVTSCGGGHGGVVDNGILQQGNCLWMKESSIKIMHSFPGNVHSTKVKLQWFCEKSGLVFFTAGKNDGDQRGDLYTLSLSTRVVEKVASNAWDGNMWDNLYGYEMDQAAYLASLAGTEKED
ncbi:hypothetical protein SETIT_6G054600v2 [Setaria italica]|uniref:F-box domain-containing protein n=3 Tax=Setaria TaxID=4554 RepID=A0A368RIB0_SETIT|nr:hypothetical protein SETIT_6G054600v2 [Setaria italica]TKW08838.1 hypothetical protein SEVIR_6G051300v2 [Setaria viridis]